MHVIKASYLKKFPIYISLPEVNGFGESTIDPVSEIEQATTFVEKEKAEHFAKRVSDYFALHPEYHYSDIHTAKVTIQEVEE